MREKKGQVWVETAIYTLMGLAIIGLVLAAALPKINARKDEIMIEQSIEAMNNIDNKIYEVLDGGFGNRRVVDLDVKKGALIIDMEEDTISWELESSFEYSEVGTTISLGRMNITTSLEKPWKVELKLPYNVDLRFNREVLGTKKIDVSPTPYSFIIENAGREGGSIVVNLGEESISSLVLDDSVGSDDSGCSVAGIFCDGNTPYTCTLGVDGYYDRVDGTACGATESCVGGSCVSVDAIPLDYVAYYKFDVDASDESGSYDGTFVDGASIVSNVDKGNVLSLDGDGDYVDLGTFDPSDHDIAISLWYYLSVGPGAAWMGLVSKSDAWGVDTSRWQFSRDASGGYLTFARKDDIAYFGSYDLEVGKWVHLVVSQDSTDLCLYVDGGLMDTTDDIIFGNDVSSILKIGNGFDGLMNDVVIYDRALSSSEVSEIYVAQS